MKLGWAGLACWGLGCGRMDWIPDSAIFLMADQGCEIEILHLDLAHDNAVLDPLQIDVDPVCVRVSVSLSLSEPESTSASRPRLQLTVHASQQPFTTECFLPSCLYPY